MFGRAGTHQLATAGRLMMGSSPMGAMVSSAVAIAIGLGAALGALLTISGPG
jgi:hypothetical protein